MEEQGAEAADSEDVLVGFPCEPLPTFDPNATYDLPARAARIDAITALGKAIAEHLVACLGSGKPGDPSGLMHKVWEALNRREWLGLNREESGILLFQLHFMLGASVL